MENFLKAAWFLWAWHKPKSEWRASGNDKTRVRALFYREMDAISSNVQSFVKYQTDEAEILNARLSRRYDPGMAVNEAANRAIEAKKAAREPSPDNLTAKQKMALEVQKQYLQRVIERA